MNVKIHPSEPESGGQRSECSACGQRFSLYDRLLLSATARQEAKDTCTDTSAHAPSSSGDVDARGQQKAGPQEVCVLS